jgi:hypothetical protein
MKKNSPINNIIEILNKEQKAKFLKIKLNENLEKEVNYYLQNEKDFAKRLEIVTNYLENIFQAINGKKLLSYKEFLRRKIKNRSKKRKNHKKLKIWKR